MLQFSPHFCLTVIFMKHGPIIVSPLSAVEQTVGAAGVTHLVTLINGDTNVPTPPSLAPENHLRLSVNDICEPYPGMIAPCEQHVATLVEFALAWDQHAPMLIHCWAGISRSTAGAFIALCALNPDIEERRLARTLRQASPTACPNRKLVALGDAALRRNGRMIEAVEEIGRGEIAVEARVFSLPLPLRKAA